MSRKIAFRAWNEDRKEWAVLVVGEKQAVMASHTEGAHEDWQQFTGLLDKNGREIYEGDYLEHPKYGKQEVVYKYGGFGIDIKGVGGFTDGFDSFSHVSADVDNCVVISNIYEN